jgi:hypothetical protein
MPGKSPTQRVEELTARVVELEKALDTYRSVTDFRVANLEKQAVDRSKIEDELRNKVAELTAKNAAPEERSRNQEKTSDRGWNIGQAAVISIVSMIGGALLSLLVQLAIKK